VLRAREQFDNTKRLIYVVIGPLVRDLDDDVDVDQSQTTTDYAVRFEPNCQQFLLARQYSPASILIIKVINIIINIILFDVNVVLLVLIQSSHRIVPNC
jgi:hypothetical protein